MNPKIVSLDCFGSWCFFGYQCAEMMRRRLEKTLIIWNLCWKLPFLLKGQYADFMSWYLFQLTGAERMRWRLEDVALEFLMEAWWLLGNFKLLWMSFLAEGRWNDATKFWELGRLWLWSAGALFMYNVCWLRMLHVLFDLIYVIWFCWSVAFVRGITVNLKTHEYLFLNF